MVNMDSKPTSRWFIQRSTDTDKVISEGDKSAGERQATSMPDVRKKVNAWDWVGFTLLGIGGQGALFAAEQASIAGSFGSWIAIVVFLTTLAAGAGLLFRGARSRERRGASS